MARQTKAAQYPTVRQYRDFPAQFPVHFVPFPITDKPIQFLHYHNGLELGWCRSGSGVFVIGSKVWPFGTGDVSVINHRERHYAQSEAGVTSDWQWAQIDTAALLSPMTHDTALTDPTPYCGPQFPNIFSPHAHPHLCELISRFFGEIITERPHYREYARSLVLQAMVELDRMPGIRGTHERDHMPSAVERITPALDLTSSDYSRSLRLKELADRCYLSVAQFRRLFTREMRKSPQRYIIELRVAMACAMLRDTRRTVAAIADLNGFSTLSSFNRKFREITGLTPRQWRQGKRTS